MRFPEYYAQAKRPVVSFEVFPPKDEPGLERLKQTIPELLALKPDFMTCTYGAGGSTRDKTIQIANFIQATHGMVTGCHLTCVGSSRAQLEEILNQMHAAGVRNIVALRGDPPKGETKFTPAPDGLAYGSELVEFIRDWEKQRGHEPLGLAVGGYPEKHFDAPDLATDLANLKRKVETGSDVVITQLFFDNAEYHRFVESARAIGIKAPIAAGLLPVLSTKQIKRIAGLCGSRIPDALQKELDAAGDDDAKAEAIGVRWCRAQVEDLLRHGVQGLHFYVLNRASHVKKILEGLR